MIASDARPGIGGRDRLLTWPVVAWVMIVFVSTFRLSGHRDPALAASGVASPEQLVELGVYTAVGVLGATEWLKSRRRVSSLGLLLFITFGVLAVASVVWSVVPLFSLVRGSQVVVLGILAYVTARRWLAQPIVGFVEWRRIWGGLVVGVAGVSAIALIWSDWPGGRFAWVGVHPGTTAEYLALAALVALSMILGPDWGLTRKVARVMPLLAVATALLLILTLTRSVTAAFLAASIVLVLGSTGGRLDVRLLAVVCVIVLILAGVMLWPTQVYEFLLRGGSTEQLLTLTGRTELWAAALQTVGDSPLVGFGYGAGRLILTELIPWSGTGHNLWVEASVSFGIIGAILVTAILGWMLYRSRRLQRAGARTSGGLGLALAVFVVLDGVAGPGFALPGVIQAVLALMITGLVAAPVIGRGPKSAGTAAGGPTVYR